MSAVGPDISLPLGHCRFNLRVSGILLREGKVLVTQSEGIPYFYPPGGRVRQNEDSRAALAREMAEELGAQPGVERLLWVAESFFFEQTSREQFHEIGFYYLLADDGGILDEASFVRENEDGRPQRFFWHPLSRLAELDLRPAFLKERLQRLPKQAEHLLDYQ